METNEYKQKLLETGIFKRVRDGQYKAQYCPFCGDRKWHMYVMIKLTDDTPVLYNCFKCNSSGRLNKKFLEYYNLENIRIPRTTFQRKIETSKATDGSNSAITVTENDNIVNVCKYIESKVGHYPTLEELRYFQYVGNPKQYAIEYLGCSPNNNGYVFKDRHWFRMTNGNISGRWKNDDEGVMSWYKYNSKLVTGRGLYTLKIPFDLCLPVNVYIAEGVMDVIGLYYNYIRDNCIYIASMGKDYEAGIRHLVSLGIFGDSVNIKIFKDSDVKHDSIHIDENLKKLFNKVDIYQNVIGHDYGVLPEKLEIQKSLSLLNKGDRKCQRSFMY